MCILLYMYFETRSEVSQMTSSSLYSWGWFWTLELAASSHWMWGLQMYITPWFMQGWRLKPGFHACLVKLLPELDPSTCDASNFYFYQFFENLVQCILTTFILHLFPDPWPHTFHYPPTLCSKQTIHTPKPQNQKNPNPLPNQKTSRPICAARMFLDLWPSMVSSGALLLEWKLSLSQELIIADSSMARLPFPCWDMVWLGLAHVLVWLGLTHVLCTLSHCYELLCAAALMPIFHDSLCCHEHEWSKCSLLGSKAYFLLY